MPPLLWPERTRSIGRVQLAVGLGGPFASRLVLVLVDSTLNLSLVGVKVTRYGSSMTPDGPPPDHLRCWVAADLVILTLRPAAGADSDGALAGKAKPARLSVLVVRRGIDPFRGEWALPGGFIWPEDADLEVTARRKLADEAGIANPGHLEQLAVYSAADRDPRGRIIAVAFLALTPALPLPTAGHAHTMESRWASVDELLDGATTLAFDHRRLLADGVERARSKLEYSPLAAAFCPDEFTVTELRRVYESVWGVPLDARNFHRKVIGTNNFLQRTGLTTRRDGGRPAELFRRGTASLLHPAMLRPAARALPARDKTQPC